MLAMVDDFSPAAVEERDESVRVFFFTAEDRDAARFALAARFRVAPVDVPDEDWARREVHRVVTSPAESLDEVRPRRREDLDLVRLVRAHPETPGGVENDAIGPVEGAGRVVGGVDRRSVREDRQPASAAVGIDGDPEDPIVPGVRHVEVAAGRIESETVRAETGETVGPQELTLYPQRGRSGRRIHRVDSAAE